MEKELDRIVSCMNQDYQYQRISFSGLVLKKNKSEHPVDTRSYQARDQ